MRRPSVLTFALVLALVALVGSMPALLEAQEASPAVQEGGAEPGPEGGPPPFEAEGVTYQPLGRTPALRGIREERLEIARYLLTDAARVPERMFPDARVWIVETGTIAVRIGDVRGEGQLVVAGDPRCAGGCPLREFIGREVLLRPGDTLSHDQAARYSFSYAGPAAQGRMAFLGVPDLTHSGSVLGGCSGRCS